MATTEFGVNDALAVKLYSKKLFQEALKQTWLKKFMGSDSDSIIQIKGETGKGAGDQVTFGLRMQLSGAGIQGDGTLEGNEEALTTYSDALIINQLRHAVRSAGKMSEQRVPFSVREESRKGLQDWWANRIDTWGFNQLCGYTVQTDTKYTGNMAVTAPDANHQVFSVGSADETVQADSTKVFTLAMIDKCVEKAKTGTVPIRPIMIGGEEKFAMFLHPYQVYDMRTSSTTGQWLDIQKAAMAGSKASNSPIYTGALGEYNGVVLHESTRVTLGVHSSTGASQSAVRRAVFCGAQAGVIGYGKDSAGGEMTWVEELFDYGNQLGVSAGMIAGLKKTRFNSADFGTIVASTYAAAH
jgi:N4-gp56 family major capsid protein